MSVNAGSTNPFVLFVVLRFGLWLWKWIFIFVATTFLIIFAILFTPIWLIFKTRFNPWKFAFVLFDHNTNKSDGDNPNEKTNADPKKGD